MKLRFSFIYIVCLFLVACQSNTEVEEIPSDLAGKKSYLKNKQAQLKELEVDIKSLEADIIEMDPSMKKAPTLVTIDTIQKSSFERFATLQGNIISEDLVNASSEIGGRILDIFVREGQNVRRGQLIAKIDLEVIQKQIAEIDISLDLANTIYERQKRLWDQNIGSEIQYLQAKNNKERLEKNLESIQFQLSKQNVYSPSSGVVEREVRQAGELTSAGGPIIQILNTNKVKVVVDAPESYLGIVKRGDYVDIKIPAIEKEFRGKISLLGRMIDPANRTFKIEVDLNNKSGIYKPNLGAEMLVKDLELDDVLVVPVNLVQQEVSGDKFVYVVDDPYATELNSRKVYISTGENYEDNVIIEEGLKAGDLLIVKGARQISNKELISIQS